MSDNLNIRRILRTKITKASRRLISLSLDELTSLRNEYDIISEACLVNNTEDYDQQKAKDDLYKQQIEALIGYERSISQLEAITIDDDDLLVSEFPTTPITSRNLHNALHQTQQSSSSSVQTVNTFPAFPTTVRASDLLNFDGNVINWLPFKMTFEDEVINNPNLLESKKRNLLLKVLQNSALDRAMDLVRQGKTLVSIWSSLNVFYNNPIKIDEQLTKQIRSLVYVNSPYESAKLEVMLREVRRLSSTCASLGAAYLARSNSLVKEVLWKCGRPLREKLCHVESLAQLEKELEKLYKSALCLDAYERREPSRFSRPASQQVAAVSSVRCLFCKRSNHSSVDCQVSLSVEEKKRVLSTNNLCFKCITPGHRANSCPRAASIRCRICQSNHPTVLHQVRLNGSQNSQNNNNNIQSPVANSSSSSTPSTSTTSSAAAPVSSTPSSVGAISVLSNQSMSFLASSSGSTIVTSSDSSAVASVHSSSANPLVAQYDGVASSSTTKERPAFIINFSGRKCMVWIDTCSPFTLIRSNLVNINDCASVPPICFSGFSGGSLTMSDKKISVVLVSDALQISIDAYVIPVLPHCDLIIGTDMLSRITKIDPLKSLKWESKFGDIYYGPVAAIENMKIDEESDDEEDLDMHIVRLENGRFEARLPFLSDTRPPSNYPVALTLLNKLIYRLEAEKTYELYRSEFMKYVTSGQAVEVNDCEGYFIPHHAVFRAESSSSPVRIVFNASFGRESSLNNLLWKGLSLGLDVFPHLIRIRLFKYLCTADLRKAFLQISIHPEHRKYIRLLWREKNGQIKKYEMTVLPFGVISSPAILTQVVDRMVQSIDNISSRKMLSGVTYMDDLLIGSNDMNDLRQSIVDAKRVFNSSGFEIHKIYSNASISDEASPDSSGLLGLQWYISDDTIGLKHRDLSSLVLTKRTLLSIIGRIFDPLGLIDPLKLQLRLLFSRIVSNEWDAPIDTEFSREWNDVIKEWPDLRLIKIDRFIPVTSTMYCFADASETGIGYCIYLGSQFLFGKSKIAPKLKTIVEKELLALLELLKMVVKIRKILNQSIINPSIRVYSDSRINLDRLNSSPNRFKCHVGKKLLRILQIVSDFNIAVFYIPGKENPADLFSRTVSVTSYLNRKPWILHLANLPNESCPVVSVCSIEKKDIDLNLFNFLNGLSSIKSMLRWVNRFRGWLPKSRQERMLNSLYVLIRCFQSNSRPNSPHEWYVDDRGLFVFRSRDGLNSIWIPPRTALARALLYDAHRRAKHNGVKLSLAQIPAEFAIGDANRSMARLIYNCIICRSRRGKAISVPFGPTYHDVDIYQGPFSRIAIDGFGPFTLRNTKKYWGLIVACLSTRCLRIGILEDLTPIAAARALKSVFHEVGYPKFILSDNGTNFKHIKLALEKAEMSVVWWTSAPLAPWQNGTAERFVQMVKSCLSVYDKNCRSLYDVVLRFREVESIINARPIISNERPISAHEFCFHRPLHLITEKVTNDFKPIDLNRLYRFNEDLRKRFTKLLKLRYFNLYRFRPKIFSGSVNVGDYVLIPDKCDRETWPTGQIQELSFGRDGRARSALICFRGSSLWRPISGLVLIPRAENCCETA